MQMVRDPSQFQVIVTSNLFGDIASDLGAQLAGGLGLAPSGNIHPGQVSLFEPVHGSAPNIAGKNIANPMGAILTAGMMLDYLGWADEGRAVEGAVRAALREGKIPAELGGSLGTREVGDWICESNYKSRNRSRLRLQVLLTRECECCCRDVMFHLNAANGWPGRKIQPEVEAIPEKLIDVSACPKYEVMHSLQVADLIRNF